MDKGVNSVLADIDLCARDPAQFNTTTFALTAARNELAAAEEQWHTLEMQRGEIEGV
jgi:hypothetical protein